MFCSSIGEKLPLGMVYLSIGNILGYRSAMMCLFWLAFIVSAISFAFFYGTIKFRSILISMVMIINILRSISTTIHVFVLW